MSEGWEMVWSNETNTEFVERFRVPGGWLYKSTDVLSNGMDMPVGVASSMSFVPEAAAARDSAVRKAERELFHG